MKVNKNKIISMLIGGVIIASAGVYALADQSARPVVTAVSSAITTNVSSVLPTQVSSASEPEVSSKMETSSKPVETKTAESSSAPSSKGQNSSGVTSLTPDVVYYDIINPETGNFVHPRDPSYFTIRDELGGDAGKVSVWQSKTCMAAAEEFLKNHPGGKTPLIPEKSPITVPTK